MEPTVNDTTPTASQKITMHLENLQKRFPNYSEIQNLLRQEYPLEMQEIDSLYKRIQEIAMEMLDYGPTNEQILRTYKLYPLR